MHTQVVSQGVTSTSATVPQGTDVQVQFTITNRGANSVDGVTVRTTVPSGFNYLGTVNQNVNGDAVRASDDEPSAGDSTLTWGAWTLGPSVPGTPSQVQITAEFQAAGAPGKVQVQPEAYASGYSNTIAGTPLSMAIAPAPSLHFTLSASPSTVTVGSAVTYHAVVTNTGSGAASGVSVSVSLPEQFLYTATSSLSGNAGTGGITYPTVQTLVPIWVGFTIPGRGSGGPGVLNIAFQVQVQKVVPTGIYQSSASVVASTGSSTQNDLMANYSALAPVDVTN